MVDEDSLTIGELARRTQVAPSALRYYEELGLLRPGGRVSGRRRYPPAAVRLVGVILFLRDVGFTLAEITQFMAARSRSPRAWQALAQRKVAELDEDIARAQVARVALEHALECDHEDILQCPNFWNVVDRRLGGKPIGEAHAH